MGSQAPLERLLGAREGLRRSRRVLAQGQAGGVGGSVERVGVEVFAEILFGGNEGFGDLVIEERGFVDHPRARAGAACGGYFGCRLGEDEGVRAFLASSRRFASASSFWIIFTMPGSAG